jgi:hypothetical protein
LYSALVVVLKRVSTLKRALSDYPEEEIFWGYTLALTGCIDRLSGGICRSGS